MIEDQANDHNTEGTSPAESRTSEETHSQRGSITHPYRTFLNDSSFARCHLTPFPAGGTETYTRSLLTLGHGIPVWDPVGDINRPGNHLKHGTMIGDVGFLTLDGNFSYYFNIFMPAGSEIQSLCPPDMEPLVPPPRPDEIVTDPNYFSPGTTLVSTGVDVTQVSASPLDVKFTINARECGILVLPDGASREDLLSTTRIHDYVQKNALNWYIFFNGGAGDVSHPNGSLCIITGCDKATSWAACTSDPRRLARAPASNLTNHYKDGKFLNHEVIPSKWSLDKHGTEKCAVFLRALRVAVNIPNWTTYILLNEPPVDIPYCNVLTVPVVGLGARYQAWKESTPFRPKEKYVARRGIKCVFHPLEPILHVLLQEAPTADVALVEDSMWCGLTSKSDSSIAQVLQLLIRILETHDILSKDGIVTLVPVNSGFPQEATSPTLRNFILRLPTLLQQKYKLRRRRREIVSKIVKVFPGPGMPAEILKSR